MMLAVAAVLFVAFVVDIVIGAMAGASLFNDVQEMLVLLAASIAFVAAILAREKTSKD